MKLKVRWFTGPMGGNVQEKIVDVDEVDAVGSMTVFRDEDTLPVLVVPSSRLVDAVESDNG